MSLIFLFIQFECSLIASYPKLHRPVRDQPQRPTNDDVGETVNTSGNPPPMHGPNVQSPPPTPAGRPMRLAPVAESTPLPTPATTSHAPNQLPNIDDDDAIFDNVDVNLSPAVQNQLSDNQSHMDPVTRQRVKQVGDSLDTPQVDRIQSASPVPNADQNNNADADAHAHAHAVPQDGNEAEAEPAQPAEAVRVTANNIF